MVFRALFAVIAVSACVLAGAARAGEKEGPHGCLDRMEQRGMVMSRHAVPFAVAIRAIHPRDGDEILRARLCYGARGMVWSVTVLSRTGKVRGVTIDAKDGSLIKDH
ncbi:MAG: hypothetical protein OJF62_003153 [Pseudolabrys sp.]|jgi:hypothetical protein|nr:hypothetical protein [Pseudolabrys sp.]